MFYWRTTGNTWRPMNEVLPAAPKNTWDVSSFAGDRGLAFQTHPTDIGERHPVWSWFLRDSSDDKWEKLSDVLAGPSASTVKVFDVPIDQGIKVAQETRQGTVRHRWFISDGKRWVDLAIFIPNVIDESSSQSVSFNYGNRVRIRDKEGSYHWYAQAAGQRWVPLKQMSEEP